MTYPVPDDMDTPVERAARLAIEEWGERAPAMLGAMALACRDKGDGDGFFANGMAMERAAAILADEG